MKNPEDSRKPLRKALWFVFGLTLVVFIVELFGSFYASSVSLLADAGHMLTDSLALLVALLAFHFARLPSNKKRTYGYYRLEILAAGFNGLLLFGMSIYIITESIQKFEMPAPVLPDVVIVIATLGLLVNLVAVRFLSKHKDNINMEGALWHVLGDLASSIMVIIGALIIKATGWHYIDPVLGLIISGVLLTGAVRLVRETLHVLLESVPRDVDIEEVRGAISGIVSVEEVHDLHIWCLASGLPCLTVHIKVGSDANRDSTLGKVQKLLGAEFGIYHTTVQIEGETFQEGGVIHE